VDDIKDIHPKNKFDVGNLLALWALAKPGERQPDQHRGAARCVVSSQWLAGRHRGVSHE
jgi:hypothetical protein